MSIKLNKMIVSIFSVIISLYLIITPSFATSVNGSKFISPKLNITESGIKFDSSETATGFKNSTNEIGAINAILKEYRHLVTVGSGIVSLTMIALFIVNFIKLGNSRGNSSERQKAIVGLVFTGIATALAGSVTLFTSLFYNFMS